MGQSLCTYAGDHLAPHELMYVVHTIRAIYVSTLACVQVYHYTEHVLYVHMHTMQ